MVFSPFGILRLFVLPASLASGLVVFQVGDCGGDDDFDEDGIEDAVDNCPSETNADQANSDGDEPGDVCDNCPDQYQPQQNDADLDGVGDACELCHTNEDSIDSDGDGITDCFDTCPRLFDPNNIDGDGDTIGDACDNCPGTPNAGQRDVNHDGVGDDCAGDAAPFTLEEATVASIQTAIRAGTLTCESLVRQYLDRIHRFDLDVSDGPPLNSLVELDSEVLEEARVLDETFAATGDLVGPLHCAPIVLKDNYDSVESTTTQGTLALLNTWTPDDATSVRSIRRAGALILGKATMDELASSVFGLSGRSGRTGNAYNPTRNSGGSSAGTGVAVAANFALMGTGSDNCASLRLPATYNGLNSLRPSEGLISLDGIFPGWSTLTGVGGPMTRTVEDLALLLDAMVGADPADPKTQDPELVRPATYTAFLNPRGLEGQRIGVLRSYGASYTFAGTNEATFVTFNRAFETLERLGATVVDTVLLPDFNNAVSTGPGYVEGIDNYLAAFDAPREDFEDMCRSELMTIFGPVEQCLYYARNNPPIDSDAYRDAVEAIDLNRDIVEQMLDELQLDAIVYPVDPYGAAQVDTAGSTCAVSAYSGMPALVLRAGFSNDQPPLPIGIEIMARKFDEPTLIEIAYAWEQGTGWRVPPTLTSVVGSDPDLPDMDIEALNDLRTALGVASFEEVTAEQGLYALTGEIFTEIVTEQIELAGLQYLLGE